MEAGSEPEIIDLTGLSESSDEGGEDGDEEDSQSSSGSSSSGVEISLDDTSRARLHEAISTVSEDRLRRIIDTLVDTMPAVEEVMTRELITLKRKTLDIVSRWATCSNCEEEFDVGAEREHDECSFHPGELEVDEDSFADWDESCHGPMDTRENRNSFPENFIWSCCDEPSFGEGCVHGEHKAAAAARKKRRI